MGTLERDRIRHDTKGKAMEDILNDFFDAFSPIEAEEILQEISAILCNRKIRITRAEEKEFNYFFGRLNELIKASYELRS